jgi:hypothetical protein
MNYIIMNFFKKEIKFFILFNSLLLILVYYEIKNFIYKFLDKKNIKTKNHIFKKKLYLF